MTIVCREMINNEDARGSSFVSSNNQQITQKKDNHGKSNLSRR